MCDKLLNGKLTDEQIDLLADVINGIIQKCCILEDLADAEGKIEWDKIKEGKKEVYADENGEIVIKDVSTLSQIIGKIKIYL